MSDKNYGNGVKECEPRKAYGSTLEHGVRYLEGVTVCVNYADFLEVTLTHNLGHFDDFVVVTHHDDKDTQEVCNRHSVRCVLTDVMYERQEQFNKGAAINVGLAHLRKLGWIMHLDADIILPDRLRHVLDMARLEKHCLYGADRQLVKSVEEYREHLKHFSAGRQYRHERFIQPNPNLEMGCRIVHEVMGWTPIGYMQLWHSSVQHKYPFNQASAEHTDMTFAAQWPACHRRLLPTMYVTHLESEPCDMGANWGGRKTKQFKP